MAPLKKSCIVNNALCFSDTPPSRPALVQVSEKLHHAGASVASSSIAMAIAAAIEAAGKRPTYISLRFDASPECPRTQETNNSTTPRFFRSSRRLTHDYDDYITMISNDSSQKEIDDETTITAPRCYALPSAIPAWSNHHHCDIPPEITSGVSSQDPFPWALFEASARSDVEIHQEVPSIASSDNNKNERESYMVDHRHLVAGHWQDMPYPNGCTPLSSTFCLPCLHEAKPSIHPLTNENLNSAYNKSDRHPLSNPSTQTSLLWTGDQAAAIAVTPKGWASPINGIRTRNSAWDPCYMASRLSTRLGKPTMNDSANIFIHAGEFTTYKNQDPRVLVPDSVSAMMDKGRGDDLAPGMTQKYKKKKCEHEGCTKYSQSGGVCCRHGAKRSKTRKYCSHEGCTNFVQRAGVCIRHGASRY